MKNFTCNILLFCVFTQTILACDDIKKDSSGLKIRGRGRAGSFLDPASSDSTPTPLSLYRSPRSSKTGTFAAYNALLEDKLQPSESTHPTFSAEMDHLQKFWDKRHAKNLSPEIRAEIGKKAVLFLHVPHIFKPKIRNQDGMYIKIHGFHHDPERLLEKSELLKIESETLYSDESYDQKISTQTDPIISARKSFFPDTWSRQETLSAILLALQNAKKCPSDEEDENKEFTGITATTPPMLLTIRIRVLPDRAFITTLHPKH